MLFLTPNQQCQNTEGSIELIILGLILMALCMVLSSWLRATARIHLMNERRLTANPETKPVDLGCESVENWQLPSTSPIAIVIIT